MWNGGKQKQKIKCDLNLIGVIILSYSQSSNMRQSPNHNILDQDQRPVNTLTSN